MEALVLLMMSCVWLGVRGGTCPSLYLRYSEHHTYCLPSNSTCKMEKNGVKDADKEVILREHNAFRSKVATGMETTYSLPKASNMLQMVWDDELASVAQKHADQCVFEHDCNDCRRVKNFGVGQNLFTRRVPTAPSKPDWAATVKGWYDEVKYFQKKQIDSFKDGKGPPATGHFTQTIWSTTWRIGCGYTLFKEGSEFVELYTCDYGPSGNTKDHTIYEKGNPCSRCPVNSCCGNSCSKQSYPGLCQISGDNAPQYNAPRGLIFFCSFNNEPDCARTTSGAGKWEVSKTLSGSYIGIVLKGGESSTLSFTTPFKTAKGSMCVTIYFRNGPQVAGQKRANTAMEIIKTPSDPNFSFAQELVSTKLGFTQFGMGLGWNDESTLSVSFSVPPGKPSQYLELEKIQVKAGEC